MSAMFNEKIDNRERCKGVHCVDLGERCPTSIQYLLRCYLQNLASIQPRTRLVKFARSPRTVLQMPQVHSCPARLGKPGRLWQICNSFGDEK